jgi:hypothetical protein
MFLKNIKLTLIILLFYQSPLYSKSNSFNNFNSKDLSKYFSGIVALENKENTKALNFFKSSKILLNKHDPYLKRYVSSLVQEKRVIQAINIIKQNAGKDNVSFFDAHLLLIVDSLKKKKFRSSQYSFVRCLQFFTTK